ncbi:TIGR03619 family F420-dependent LLM class oxidoreductase [Jatrophihabitans cynanchi]|uniref:TIGR03619 family F420-dependent LLM class oxidoreductase n=1 Tax=Jatrophihabitans cynanchi TaxID=2944128 RepID=A0ABY7K3I3_9ACTN|nr:TIGR03619 family F420-dependent LLM class oxidoreductase [Jatrophihabitans sp. SB3-54]WAX58468.1 TIGR03619 family F420-dependent LLM class oxidoreductase [Jatrophihabitans sp. SB3-54]
MASSPIRVGFQLPQWGGYATREPLLRLAREAEAAGFDSVWASDHIVFPAESSASYPYSASGEPPFRAEDGYLEVLTMLAVVAGATERIGLGTSVLVLPMRETLLTAKAVATLDVLSCGRVVLAVSTGWWREEFAALGADFDARGAVLDAQLLALRTLWTDGAASAPGPHVEFAQVVAEPRPAQRGGPEIWIGGQGPRVWARIANSQAVGWHGIGYQRERIASARSGIARACERAGSDAAAVGISLATGMPTNGDRMLRRVAELRDAGVRQVVFIPRGEDLPALLDGIETFAREVRPALGS